MATTFTTWTALYNHLLDQLASGQMLVGSVTIGGKTISYRPESFKIWFEIAEQRAAAEQSSGNLCLRTYAKPVRS
jgi:hypothetical protein